jgi:mitochondrial fission protein ELM1
MLWNIGPVNEYEAQSAVIPFICIIIRKEYELRQQSHLIFISRRVPQRKKSNFSRRQNVLLIVLVPVPVLVLSDK